MTDIIFKVDIYVMLILLTLVINIGKMKKLDFSKRAIRFLGMSITVLIGISLIIIVMHICVAEEVSKIDFYFRSVIYIAEHLAIIFLFAMGFANFTSGERIVKYKRVLLTIPLIIVAALLFINIYVPNFIFDLSDTHEYIKGRYFFLITLVKLLYFPLIYIIFNKQIPVLSKIDNIALSTTVLSNCVIALFQLTVPEYLFEIPIFFCNFLMINAFYLDTYINRDEVTGLLKYKNVLETLKTDKEYTFILIEFTAYVDDTKLLVTEKLKRFANILTKAVDNAGIVTKYEANKYMLILEDEKNINAEDLLTVIETNVRNENMHYEGHENIDYVYEIDNTKDNKQHTLIDFTLTLVYKLILKKENLSQISEE